MAILAPDPRSILQLSWRVQSSKKMASHKGRISKVLRKASPYAYGVLADRAYGKLKETHAIEHSRFDGISTSSEKYFKELEQKLAKELGYVKVELLFPLPADDDAKVQ